MDANENKITITLLSTAEAVKVGADVINKCETSVELKTAIAKAIAGKEICLSCRFSAAIANPSYHDPTLECRRMPPTQATDKQRADKYPFPIVSVNCWCGEFKTKPETGE